MNHYSFTKTILAVILMALSSKNSDAQYLQRLIVHEQRSENPSNYTNIASKKIVRLNGKAYVSWTVMNDTLQGVFAVYKSRGYNSIEAVEFLTYPKGIAKNLPVLFSVVDSTIEENSIYHIVKIDSKALFWAEEHVVFRNTVAELRLPEEDMRIEERRMAESKRDLYSQGF